MAYIFDRRTVAHLATLSGQWAMYQRLCHELDQMEETSPVARVLLRATVSFETETHGGMMALAHLYNGARRATEQARDTGDATTAQDAHTLWSIARAASCDLRAAMHS